MKRDFNSKKTLRKYLLHSHSFLFAVYYNAIMSYLKRGFFYFFWISLFVTASYAASPADPGPEFFPPLPPDQEMQREDLPEDENHPLPPEKPFPFDSDDIIHYRGQRLYLEETPLKVNHIKYEALNESLVCIEIFFNQSINPRSITHESFLLDEEPLPDSTRFAFNRKGDIIKIIAHIEYADFYLRIQDIRSFNGTIIEPVGFEIENEDDEESAEEQPDSEQEKMPVQIKEGEVE